MKGFFVHILFLTPFFCISQANAFSMFVEPGIVASSFKEAGLTYKINNSIAAFDSNVVKIRSHWPAFDTIYYLDSRRTDSSFVITRFKPGEKYAIVISCCGSLDIIRASKLKVYKEQFALHYEQQPGSNLSGTCYDRLNFSFQLSSPTKDTLLAVFAEWSGFPFGIIMKPAMSNYYGPDKGFYWNNITMIHIARSKTPLRPDKKDKSRIEDTWFEDINVLKTVCFRFFNNEKICLLYDPEKDKLDVRLMK